MEVANQILAQMNEQLPLVEPVVRHGSVPSFIQAEQFDALKLKKSLKPYVKMAIDPLL